MTLSVRDVGWPEEFHVRYPCSESQISDTLARVNNRLHDLRLSETVLDSLVRLYLPLAMYLYELSESEPNRALVIGFNGAQGSGKSTAVKILRVLLRTLYQQHVCIFSIDDLYLTKRERIILAQDVHPLLVTRGVPGTHDIQLGITLMDELLNANTESRVPVVQFDKARDDRCELPDWEEFYGKPDIILFEGWCVGAVPQPEFALTASVNELEEREDPDLVWRRYVNSKLHDYQRLFGLCDLLVMLKVPSYDKVFEWRALQEQKLADEVKQSMDSRPLTIMNDAELRRFIMHYQRLTCWMLEEMPSRVDFLLALDGNHNINTISIKEIRKEPV